MINSKEELKEYLEADRMALGRKKKPDFLDLVWKYEISLRNYEYYHNCRKGILWKPLRFLYRLKYEFFSIILNTAINQRKGFSKKAAYKFAKYTSMIQEPILVFENYFALYDIPIPEIEPFEKSILSQTAIFSVGQDLKKEASLDIMNATRRCPIMKQSLLKRVTEGFIRRAKGQDRQKDENYSNLVIG